MRIIPAFACILLLIGSMAAQAPSSSQPNGTGPANSAESRTETRFAPGSKLRLELDKSIDAKKAKVGDPVVAKMMDEVMSGDKVVAPRGAKVMGHVAEVTLHEKDTPSTLGIAFDKMVVNNAEVPFSATIQALAEPQNSFGQYPGAGDQNASVGGTGPGLQGGQNAQMGGRSMGGGGSTGYPGGGSQSNSQNQGAAAPNDTAPQSARGQITTNSTGVIGMSGVTLGTGSAGDSLLTNPKHNVKLDTGTQMVVVTK
jgi:hypothetical protein